MSTSIRGTIQKTSNRQWKGKTFYSFKVDDVWYSVGTKSPPSEGTLVEFEADQNEKGYWDVTKNGIKTVAAEAPKTLAGVANKVNLSKDDYWTRKEERDLDVQKRIERQSARNSSLALIEILVKTDALTLPAKPKRALFLEGLLDAYTERFIVENTGKKESVDQEESEQEDAEVPADAASGDWN